jgi:hypothetical protein
MRCGWPVAQEIVTCVGQPRKLDVSTRQLTSQVFDDWERDYPGLS